MRATVRATATGTDGSIQASAAADTSEGIGGDFVSLAAGEVASASSPAHTKRNKKDELALRVGGGKGGSGKKKRKDQKKKTKLLDFLSLLNG